MHKRIVILYIFRFQHIAQIGQAEIFSLLAHPAPERIDHAVGHFHERSILVAFFGTHFIFSGNHIVPEYSLCIEELLDVVYRRHPFHRFGAFFPSPAPHRHTRIKLRAVGITGTEDRSHIARIIGKPALCPLQGFLHRNAVLIEQIARTHDIVVAMMCLIHHTGLFQFTVDGSRHALQFAVSNRLQVLR